MTITTTYTEILTDPLNADIDPEWWEQQVGFEPHHGDRP